jgi:hypothetical protein
MPATPSVAFFQVYFKIPHSQISKVYMLEKSWTITTLLDYVQTQVRNMLQIHARYAVELVAIDQADGEFAPAIVPNDEQTLLQRYGDINTPIAFYVRPVNPTTREYVQNIDYRV